MWSGLSTKSKHVYEAAYNKTMIAKNIVQDKESKNKYENNKKTNWSGKM